MQDLGTLAILGLASVPEASNQTTPSLIVPRIPTQGKEYLLIGSGAISSAVITHASCTIKVAFSPICIFTLKP